MKNIYMVGIKGTGMSALAQVLVDLGYNVKGSDVEDDYFTSAGLSNKRIECLPFNENNIRDENSIYIASSCYLDDFVEVKKIKEKGFEFYYYHEFIEKYFKGVKIGVSGAHGKTTTTSFISDLFGDKKICSIIGDGRGKGEWNYDYFIFEACEYKDHILSYTFDYLIINNIDEEHLDYFKNINEIKKTFEKASKNAKCLIINENVEIEHPNKYAFGLNKNNFCYYEINKEYSWGYDLNIFIDKKEKINIKLSFPGEHMIYNLLASLIVYYLCFKNLDNIQEKINKIQKPRRRMEEYSYKTNILIDDYAHHPTEIKALIRAIKQKYQNKKIIILFKPHTYSRTLNLKNQFKDCFKDIDELYIDETFTSKREKKDEKKEKEVFSIFEKAKRFSFDTIKGIKKKDNCIILFLGAGDINKNIKDIIM